MGWEKAAANLAIVDKQIADLKIKLKQDADIVQQLSIAREFFADEATLSPDELNAKWKDRFLDFYKAQLTVGVLSEAIRELATKQKEPLGKYLSIILGGNLTQGGPAGGQPRDYFYELWLASVLSEAGFIVHFQEPDLVIEGNGLSQKIAIACKYPSSDKGIHEHLNKALSQIKKHGIPGFIALGIDQIVVEKANLKKYVDFNQGGKNPIDVLQHYADKEVMTLVNERPQKYPSEDPVDEIVVTLSLAGHYGKPAQLISPTVLAIHCSNASPIKNDIEMIVNALGNLPGKK
jgi:hypothetical protein